MKSGEHAAVGAVVGALAVFVLFPDASLSTRFALWAGGLFLSVFVDLDHFVVARAMSGTWTHLRRALSNPRVAWIDQEQVFVGVDTVPLERYRLLSHLLVGGVLVAGLAAVTVRVAAFVSVLLYAHVVADLLRDAELA